MQKGITLKAVDKTAFIAILVLVCYYKTVIRWKKTAPVSNINTIRREETVWEKIFQ